MLRELEIEIHLVITKMGEKIIELEAELPVVGVRKLFTQLYEVDDFTAPIASGSFKTDGMIVIPCSMKTLAGIANGYSYNLLLRAADVS